MVRFWAFRWDLNWIFSLLIYFQFDHQQVYSQVFNIPINLEYNALLLGSAADSTFNFHTSSRPYLMSDIHFFNKRMSDLNLKTEGTWMNRLLNADTIDSGERKIDIYLHPILEAIYSPSPTEPNDNSYSLAGGLSIGGYYSDRIAMEFNYQYNLIDPPQYLETFTQENSVIPGYGPAERYGNVYRNRFYTGYLSYSPAKYVNFQVGRGKNFIGNGYRSLILSDNSNAHYYGKIDLNIWKIRYCVLYSQYKDMNGLGFNESAYLNKYSTSNFLSINLGKHANVGLFQTVIWQATDSNLNRGFDINYLNPFIFLRPVEYSVGSPDNVLLGLDVSYLLFKKIKLYGQVIIDEFLLNELRSNSGWWANKYGFQLGTKINDFFNLNGLTVLAEYNYVRPFTFSHSNVVQNYGNYNQPLAHPLGANFDEIIGRITYQRKRWLTTLHMALARKGEDYTNTNFGGDIFQSNTTRTMDYGNRTGQGQQADRWYFQAKTGYLLNPAWKLFFEIGYTYRREQQIAFYPSETNLIHIGIRTLLYNRYLDL